MGSRIKSSDIPIHGEFLKNEGKLAHWMNILKWVALSGAVFSESMLIWGAEHFKMIYAYSWLWGFGCFLTLALGGTFWLLLHNLSNSSWGISVRRVMENLASVFPYFILFALPFLFPSVQAILWEWMEIQRETLAVSKEAIGHSIGVKDALLHSADPHNHLLATKTWYLNLPFWHYRFVLYFVVLGGAIWWLKKLSVRQDEDPNPGTANLFKARKWSAGILPLFAIVTTFSTIDWYQGLDFSWFSTMWGVYWFSGSALGSMSLIALIVILLKDAGYFKAVVGQEHFHIMGKLMFAFVIFWAYIAFSQFFLIWYANITEETRYFLLRNTNGWHGFSVFLVVAHFFIPFVLLLPAWVKRNTQYLRWLCLYLLILHFLDLYHIVIPERGPSVSVQVGWIPQLWLGGFKAVLLDVFAFLVIGSGFAYCLLRQLTTSALYPHRDPRIVESANLHN